MRKAGCALHRRKKARVRRRHHRQMVAGLVVNDRVNLSRETRRRLRAIEHRFRMQDAAADAPLGSVDFHRRKRPTVGRRELEGWRVLVSMIERQTRQVGDE